MFSRNQWGGTFEVTASADTYDTNRSIEWEKAGLLDGHNNQPNHHDLDETLQSWVLEPPQRKKKKKYVDFGCIVCSYKALKWGLLGVLVAFCVIALPIIITKSLPKHKSQPGPPDNYTLALHKALLFFNAQKCKTLLSLSLHVHMMQNIYPFIHLRLYICSCAYMLTGLV